MGKAAVWDGGGKGEGAGGVQLQVRASWNMSQLFR